MNVTVDGRNYSLLSLLTWKVLSYQKYIRKLFVLTEVIDQEYYLFSLLYVIYSETIFLL